MPRMLRPKMTVLPDSALTSAQREAPAKGPTHEVTGRQPYFLRTAAEVGTDAPPDGQLSKGDKVSLVSRGAGPLCRVRDEQGRHLITAYSGLRKLP
jgi:hypothetical protein